MQKATGTCKWWNTQKGYGFITPSDGSSEVFVHQTAIQSDGFRSLAEGKIGISLLGYFNVPKNVFSYIVITI